MSAHKDVHSFSRPDEVTVTHLDLTLHIDFNTKALDGIATWRIHNKTAGKAELILDINGLDISAVQVDGVLCDFVLGKEFPFVGRPVIIEVNEDTLSVTVFYKASPNAAAIQWLSPEQTSGKKHPFLFTQSEAILARTWIPCQDSPGVRFTYDAKVKVPKGYMAVMSADNPRELNEKGYYSFRMIHPIPSYLMALAAGNLVFSPTGVRTGVYAEPEMIEASVYEFAEMEDMLHAAEKLYGAYPWGGTDLIVLPPSFPFGGMENPCLTFCTPTILAGDRSLTSLVAHELAHSWSGNLVTNATWDDFWLNEGFTMYFERRIMEALYGADYAEMLTMLGQIELLALIKDLGEENPDTQLKLNLAGRDPDDGMNLIAYEKGFFFLLLIQHTVGRERFDAFLNKYFKTFAFHSMDTERFLIYLKEELLENDKALIDKINIDQWVYKPGLPFNMPIIKSARFDAVFEAVEAWESGVAPEKLDTKKWSAHEWVYFIKKLPATLNKERMADLDAAFHFTGSANAEITAAWMMQVIKHWYAPAYERLEEFLIEVGRRKFIVPLYKALVQTDQGRVMAKLIYHKARPGYHYVASMTLDEVVGE